MSLATAKAIVEKLDKNEVVVSIISEDAKLNDIIKKNIGNDNFQVHDTEVLSLLSFKVNSIISQKKIVKAYFDKVENFLKTNNVERIFITYPLHLDSYVYFRVAKKIGIKVAFYEEGPCFYRQGRTKQYNIVNVRTMLRKVYFSLVGLNFGYEFKPQEWYSLLPVGENSKRIEILYNDVGISNTVRNVFLSRPASDDYPLVTIDDEVNAIKSYYNQYIDPNDTLYIKFHPRESNYKIKMLMKNLKLSGIKVECIEGDFSSEDLLFSMRNGTICGYDSTTLVYSNNINKNVKAISLLGFIKDKDKTGFLNECYDEYVKLYGHIKMFESFNE